MKLYWKIWGVLMLSGAVVLAIYGTATYAAWREWQQTQAVTAQQASSDDVSSRDAAAVEPSAVTPEAKKAFVRRLTFILFPTMVVVMLAGFLTSLYICISIHRPIGALSDGVRAITRGDLTAPVEYDFPPYGLVREFDEIGSLLQQMDQMRQSLTLVVRDTKTGVTSVEGASEDFLKSSGQLNDSMNVQGQLLRDVENNVTRIAGHMRFVADNIPQALRRTSDTVSDIGHIQSSLQEISSSVKALDEFVDDTAGVVTEFSTTMEAINQNTASLKDQVEDSAAVISDMVESITHASSRSDTLGRSVNKTVAAIEEMVLGLGNLKQLAEGMDETLGSTQNAMGSMVQGIVNVETSAKSLGQSAKQSKRMAEEGGLAVQRTIEGMNTIQRTVRSASRTVRSLGEEGKKIGEIVDTVAAIAEQTNLLALNAAIEAARAGEHGKGFAVVADEVRALAEKSQRATKEITQLVTKIRQGTEEAVRSMEEGNTEVERGHSLANEAGEALGRIVDGVRQTSALIDQIVEKTTEQNAQTENLRRVLNEVLRYGEVVRDFTKKQEGGTKAMRRTMSELKDIARELKEHTNQQLQGTGRIQQSVEKLRSITQHIAGSTEQQDEGASQMLQSIQSIKKKTASIKGATEQQTRDGDRILESSTEMKRMLEQVGVRVKDLDADSSVLVERTQRAFEVVQTTLEESDRIQEKTQGLQKVVQGLRRSVQQFSIAPSASRREESATGLRLLDERGEA